VAEALSIFIVHPSALLTDHRAHGDGLAAHSFIAGLADRGHRLHVAVEDVDLERELGPRVTLHPVRSRRRPPAARRLGFALGVRALFARLQTEVGFDLAHQLNPVDVGLSLFLPRSHVPLVLGPYVPLWPPEEIGLRDRRRQRLLGRPLDGLRSAVAALQQRRATMLLLSTPAARERLHGSGPAAVAELPYGVDVHAFDAPAGPSEGDDGPILFLAGLERWKGLETLLDAFELAAGELGGRRLAIAGDGALAGALRRRVAGSPAGERIDVLGRVERHDVPALLRRSSIYCLPSVREPFGISALEAMACARPVVATDAGGLRHLVGDEGGRLVPPRDAASLAGALTELSASPELRRAMGAHNRRLVHERFSWERVVARLEAAYRHAIALARDSGVPSKKRSSGEVGLL
jgi:glycosyltransferase involved in cell wall biosynthesis